MYQYLNIEYLNIRGIVKIEIHIILKIKAISKGKSLIFANYRN